MGFEVNLLVQCATDIEDSFFSKCKKSTLVSMYNKTIELILKNILTPRLIWLHVWLTHRLVRPFQKLNPIKELYKTFLLSEVHTQSVALLHGDNLVIKL